MGLIKELLDMAKASKKVAKKATKKVTNKKVAKKASSKKVAKKTTTKKKTTKKVAKKAAKKVTKKVAKKVAKKVTKKQAAKKVAKKVTKKQVVKKAPAKKVTKKAPAKKVTKKTTVKKVEQKAPVKKVKTKAVADKVTTKKDTTKSNNSSLEEKKVEKFTKEAVVKAQEKRPLKAKVVAPEVLEEAIDSEVSIDDVAVEGTSTPAASSANFVPPKKVEIAEAEARVNDEIAVLSENFSWQEIADAISSLDFFVDHRSDDCAEKGCDNLRTSQQYCRLHYIANWYDIQKKREILKEGKLQQYIEELVSKYPPKLIESLLSDLQDDKEFYRALNELNIHSDMEIDDVEFDAAEDDDDADEDIAVETRNFTSSQRFEDEQ